MKTAPCILAFAPLAVFLGLLGSGGCAGKSGKTADSLFVTKVRPTLEYYCMECHNSESASKSSQFNLETGKLAMSTGLHKPVIKPGKPEESLLYVVLRLGHAEALAMPPAPDKVSDEQLAAVHRWIAEGAFWPEGPEGRLHRPR